MLMFWIFYGFCLIICAYLNWICAYFSNFFQVTVFHRKFCGSQDKAIDKFQVFPLHFRIQIIVRYSLCNNFSIVARISAPLAFFFWGIANQLRPFVMYHLCFCEFIYMWCTPNNLCCIICVFAKLFICDVLPLTEKKNLTYFGSIMHQNQPFPHANTQCPDEQNATNRSA